jgi:hypothetical protein
MSSLCTDYILRCYSLLSCVLIEWNVTNVIAMSIIISSRLCVFHPVVTHSSAVYSHSPPFVLNNRLLDTASFTLPRKCWKTSRTRCKESVVSLWGPERSLALSRKSCWSTEPSRSHFSTPVATSTNRTVSPRVEWGPLIRLWTKELPCWVATLFLPPWRNSTTLPVFWVFLATCASLWRHGRG